MLHLLGLVSLVVALPARSLSIPSSNENASVEPGTSSALSAALPEGCLVSVDAKGLAEVLGHGLEDPLVAALLDTDLGRAWRASDRSPVEALARLETWLGASPPDTLRALTAEGLALGWYGEAGGIVIAGRGSTDGQVSRAIETVLAALGRQFGVPAPFFEAHVGADGTRTWTLGEAHLVHAGRTWVLGQREELVRSTADRSLRGESATGSTAPGRTVVVRLDLRGLAEAGNPGVLSLRRSARAPGFRFLLGDALTETAGSGMLSVRLELRASALHLEVAGDPSTSLVEARDSAVVPPIDLGEADDLAFAIVHRDVARWIHDRAALFPVETLPRFSEALGNATLFAGGRDVERDVLPALSPWWTLLVREPDFGTGTRPAIDLPGLAVIVPVRSEEAGEAWIEAFQTVVAISNVEAAQQGRRGLRLGLERHGEVTISRAHAGSGDGAERGDLRDNLVPAVATRNGLVILATHVSLVHEVLDRLDRGRQVDEPPGGEQGALDIGAIARLVDRHRAPLALQKRLEEGLSADDAEREIEILRAILASFGRLEWSVSTGGPTTLALDLPLRIGIDAR